MIAVKFILFRINKNNFASQKPQKKNKFYGDHYVLK